MRWSLDWRRCMYWFIRLAKAIFWFLLCSSWEVLVSDLIAVVLGIDIFYRWSYFVYGDIFLSIFSELWSDSTWSLILDPSKFYSVFCNFGAIWNYGWSWIQDRWWFCLFFANRLWLSWDLLKMTSFTSLLSNILII